MLHLSFYKITDINIYLFQIQFPHQPCTACDQCDYIELSSENLSKCVNHEVWLHAEMGIQMYLATT